MKRFSRIAAPVCVLACAFVGAGQQRKHPATTKTPVSEPAAEPAPSSTRVQAIRDNNTGLALMERQQFTAALPKFQSACIMDTASDVGCMNMGIAFLYMRQYDDARRVLAKSTSKDAKNPRAWFNLGLVEKALGATKDALQNFQKAAALDPNDADTQYFIGELLSRNEQYSPAAAAYSNALKLNPLHASAELGLADVAQHAGDTDAALAHLNRFRHLTSDNLSEPISVAYGLQGKYSRVQELPREVEKVSPAASVRFVDVTSASGLPDAPFDAARSGAKRDSSRVHADKGLGAAGLDQNASSLAGFLGSGACVFDYDGDGKPDIFLVNGDGAGNAMLFRNTGDGKFANATKAAKLEFHGQGTGCAVGDYDNDGYLDLYVANYVDLDLNHLPEFGQGPFCQYRGIPVSCGPRGLKGGRDRLYHNNGDGTFTDVTEKLNIDPDSYYGLGVLWLDYDLDGCPDLYVANDSSPSLLYHGDCKGGFTEVGVHAGVAYSADGREQAGMGIDSADYDNDGWPDITKANFSDDTNNLFHNDHNGEFTDLAGAANFGPISTPFLGFGIKFLDFDNDGWKDIFVANGHVNPQVDGHSFGVTYAERPLLFRNLKNGKFEEIGMNAGTALTRRYVARGVATADFFNDGSEDVLVSVLDGSPLLLRNETAKRGHWLRIKVVGTSSNRDGLGARVQVKAGALTQNEEVRANSSFESASDPRLHFGLGAVTLVDSVIIHWPSGKVDTIESEKADQELVVQEGRGVLNRNPGTQTNGKTPVNHPKTRQQ